MRYLKSGQSTLDIYKLHILYAITVPWSRGGKL